MNYKFIIAQKYKIFKHRSKLMIKNHKSVLLIFLLAAVMFLPTAINLYINNINIVTEYNSEIFIFILSVITLYGIIEKKHILKVHHADILYLNEDALKKSIKLSLLKKILFNLCFSIIIILGVYLDSGFSLFNFIILLNVFNGNVVCNFYNYHKSKYSNCKIVFLILNILTIVTLEISFIKIGLMIVRCLVNCILYFQINNVLINRNLLLSELTTFDRIQHAARCNNFFEMQSIQLEANAMKKKKYSLTGELNTKNILLKKNILSLARTDLKIVIYLMTVSIVILFLLSRYMNVDIVIAALLGGVIINIKSIILKQKNNLLYKHRQGLYLSFSNNELNFSFFIIYIFFLTIVYISVIIILKLNFILSGLLFLVTTIVLFILDKVEYKINPKMFWVVYNSIVVLLVYILIK